MDLNTSDDDCIYSTLVYISEQAKQLKVSTPNITFDQPLYMKAVDIVPKAHLNIVVRLGGFHMLMSFLGSIGHLMKGTGFEDAMGVLVGPNTVAHVLSGKAYARAIRGHFIIYKALSDVLLDYLKCQQSKDDEADSDDGFSQPPVCLENDNHLHGSLTPSIVSGINDLYDKILHDGYNDNEELQDTCLLKCSELLDELKSVLSKQSRTAKLWIYYLKCIDLVKLFLVAKRTCNWLLHLHIVRRMLPIFAATGR